MRRPTPLGAPASGGFLPSLGALSLAASRGAPVAADETEMEVNEVKEEAYDPNDPNPRTVEQVLERKRKLEEEVDAVTQTTAEAVSAQNRASAAAKKAKSSKAKAKAAKSQEELALEQAAAQDRKMAKASAADERIKKALAKINDDLIPKLTDINRTAKQWENEERSLTANERVIENAVKESKDAVQILAAQEARAARRAAIDLARKRQNDLRNADLALTAYVRRLKQVRDAKKKLVELRKAREILARRDEAAARKEIQRTEAEARLADRERKALKAVSDKKCADAQRELHRMREKIKQMATKYDAMIKKVEENCDPDDERAAQIETEGRGKTLDDLVEPWVMEMYKKLAALEEWIEEREEADPDGWDMEEHEALLDEGLVESSDEDEGDTVEQLPESRTVGGQGSWYSKGAKKGEGNLFDDIDEKDAALLEETYGERQWAEGDQGFEIDQAADENSAEQQIDFLVRMKIENWTEDKAAAIGGKIVKNYLGFVKELESTAPWGFNEHNVVAYELRRGEFVVSLLLTEELIQQGRNTPEGEETPRDIIENDLVELTWLTWQKWVGKDLADVIAVVPTGVPSATPEEAAWLDSHFIGWQNVTDPHRLLGLITQAQNAVLTKGVEKELEKFLPTKAELQYVYESQRKVHPSFPEDWLDNKEYWKEGDLDSGMVLILLQQARDTLDNAWREDESKVKKGDEVIAEDVLFDESDPDAAKKQALALRKQDEKEGLSDEEEDFDAKAAKKKNVERQKQAEAAKIKKEESPAPLKPSGS